MKKICLFLAVCLLMFSLSAAVKLPALFSDHAVLARRAAVPVWGWANPGEKVTVTLGKAKGSVTADKKGCWCVKLNLADFPAGPFELNVNNLSVKDVVVGELWLCAGQSNMQFRLGQALTAKTECAKTDTGLRTFNVPIAPAGVPQSDCGGKWVVSTPDTNENFSAVAYFFGKKLRSELKRPVGLIHSSYGGTSISCWIPKAVTEKFPEEVKLRDEKLKIYQEYPGKLKRAVDGLAAWEKQYNRADRAKQTLPDAKSVWSAALNPASYTGAPGAVWFRNEFTLAEIPKNPGVAWIRQNTPITCYVNGVKVASHPVKRAVQRESFSPKIPRTLLKKGKNVIMYRVFCSYKAPAFSGGLVVAGVGLDRKKWQSCVEYTLPPVSEAMRKALPEFPAYSAPVAQRLGNHLYNGMIAPLRPAALSGVIWYQGENDQNIADRYGKMVREMILAWRKDFNNPELPFYYCQLPAIYDKSNDPGAESKWTSMRIAQDGALELPHTGGAVLFDCGEAHDIHYLDKRIPGERLAALALTQVYNQKKVCQSPRMTSCRLENGKIRIRFANTGSGLIARPLPKEYPLTLLNKKYGKVEPHLPGSPLQGFAVCNQAGKWFWAKAEIDGNEVVVTPPETPVKVRYGWEANPTCNLYNKEGFPAAQFQCAVK